MANNRAVTHSIRDNSIFGIIVLKNGEYRKTLPYYHNRQKHDGTTYSGPVPHGLPGK